MALEVVEHCYYPRRLAAPLAALARPGGLVILSTPYHGYAQTLALALPTQAGLVLSSADRAGRLAPTAKSMILCARRPVAGPD